MGQKMVEGSSKSGEYPIVGGEDIMKAKAHGTSEKPVMENLRYGCDFETADRICNFNRHYAEHSGYAFTNKISWVEELRKNPNQEVTTTTQSQANHSSLLHAEGQLRSSLMKVKSTDGPVSVMRKSSGKTQDVWPMVKL